MRASHVDQHKNPHATAGDTGDAGLIPGSGRSPGVRNGSTLQYSCLENSMDRGAWRTTVHEVAEWDTTGQLSTQQEWGHARGPLIHLWNLSRLTENLSVFPLIVASLGVSTPFLVLYPGYPSPFSMLDLQAICVLSYQLWYWPHPFLTTSECIFWYFTMTSYLLPW